MLKIGITGSIGSGKSTVCKILETMGVPVYYADERGKYLLQYNPEVKWLVIEAFGNDIYQNNIPDRAALAEIVFNDVAQLTKLESIIHPAVMQDFKDWYANQHAPYIVKEAALLFEAETYKDLDKIATVSAPFEIRLKRVMERDHISRKQVMARINKQWPDEKKIAMADYVIYNDDEQLLLPQILKLHTVILNLKN